MKTTKNKGEWTELLVFLKLLHDQEIYLSDKDLKRQEGFFNIKKVTTKNLNLDFLLLNKAVVNSINSETGESNEINISTLLNEDILKNLTNSIVNGRGTFEIPEFRIIQDTLGFNVVKGGNSFQKSDIVLDVESEVFQKQNEGFGIKSYLGSKPTLLNASGNTNFIFEVEGIKNSLIDEINAIDTRTKLTDRIQFIEKMGGTFKYIGAEKESME